MSFERLFYISLLVTISVESIILIIMVKMILHISQVKISQLIFVGIFASFSTFPYLWLFVPMYFPYPFDILAGEVIVIALEAIIIRYCLNLRLAISAVISLSCNLASYLVGMLVF